MTIKLRYKKPDRDVSRLIVHAVNDEQNKASASDNFRFSAAVAEFGMLLRNSAYKQASSFEQVVFLASSAKGKDVNGYRQDFIGLAQSTIGLAKQ